MTEHVYQQSFGAWMRQQRKELGLSRTDVAERLGDVHRRSVENWERAKCSMSAYNERRIRAMFKLEREAQEARKGKQVSA